MTATRNAVQGSIRTAEGEQVKLYPAKNYAHAEQMLADLEGVQADQGLKVDAEIVIVADDAPTTPTVVPDATVFRFEGLHVGVAPSLPAGILAAAFAASSPKPSHFLTALADLNARPAA